MRGVTDDVVELSFPIDVELSGSRRVPMRGVMDDVVELSFLIDVELSGSWKEPLRGLMDDVVELMLQSMSSVISVSEKTSERTDG